MKKKTLTITVASTRFSTSASKLSYWRLQKISFPTSQRQNERKHRAIYPQTKQVGGGCWCQELLRVVISQWIIGEVVQEWPWKQIKTESKETCGQNYWLGKWSLLLYYRKRIIFTLDMTGTHKLLTQIKHTFGRDTFIKSEKAPGTGVVANTLPCPAVSAPRSTAQEHGLGSGLPWTCFVLCPGHGWAGKKTN